NIPSRKPAVNSSIIYVEQIDTQPTSEVGADSTTNPERHNRFKGRVTSEAMNFPVMLHLQVDSREHWSGSPNLTRWHGDCRRPGLNSAEYPASHAVIVSHESAANGTGNHFRITA